jgi:hypothetical protein
MAFVEIYTDSSLLPLFCNVHAPVGPMAANLRPDVLLVQYLLEVFFDTTGEAKPYPAPQCLLHHSSASLRE